MGWIRYPNKTGLQAIHKANGKEVAIRPFRFTDYGYDRAHEVARRWLRYCTYVRPPLPRIKHKPLAFKTQPYIRGVSYSEFETRGTCYARMCVYWNDGEKPRNKSFMIGRVEHVTEAELQVAVRAATAFRKAYVAHKTDGEPFDPSRWRNWREYFT